MRDVSPSASHTLEWMWHDEPASPMSYFAMNVSDRPWSPAISLARVLVDRVPVGHLQRVGVLEVDLVLTEPRLALRELDRDPCLVDAVADRWWG